MMQRTDVEIGGLCEADVAMIAEIEKLSFAEPWSEQSIRDELTTPFSEYFVCRKDGNVLGYIGTRIILDECDITNIAVHPSYRRHGVATVIFAELCENLSKRGIKTLNLEVRVSNTHARRFYEKCGFAPCGTRKNYYHKPDEDAILMSRSLED